MYRIFKSIMVMGCISLAMSGMFHSQPSYGYGYGMGNILDHVVEHQMEHAVENRMNGHESSPTNSYSNNGNAPAHKGDLPDPRLTPGAINPNVTQANIMQTICVKGYTKTIRPPAYYTNKLKKEQIAQYGYADTNPKDYEEDHFLDLANGGNPTDPHNLWPQPRNSEWGADKKDALEFVMHEMVCHGEISLKDSQTAILSNWIDAWKVYVPSHPKYRFHGS